MSKAIDIAVRSYRPLIKEKQNGGYYVLISHAQLDDLIGRLMQMFELNGDAEQRNALKQETKWRCREWLDANYENSGYERNHGISKDAKVTEI